METAEQKIARLLKTPPIFNWVQHVFPRSDDTLRSLERLAQRPIGRSLRSTYRLCAELAYREIDFEEAQQQIDKKLQGYSQAAAKEIVPVFYEEITRRQFDTIPEYKGENFPYPIGRAPDGNTLTIPIAPTFVAFEAGRLLPVFVLGWRSPIRKLHRIRLVSAIIHRSILTWQEFQGSDALIMTFCTGRWSNAREPQSWYTSRYADMSDAELQEHFDRYNKALHHVIAELKDEKFD